MKQVRLAWALVVIGALLLAGCAGGLRPEGGASPVDPIQQAAPEANLASDAAPAAAGMGGAEKSFTVVAVDYKFQPPELRVKKGDKVTIRFENRGTQRHEFELPDFDFEISPLQPGNSLTKSFTATKDGVFPFECHVDDHRAKGMKGILIVEK